MQSLILRLFPLEKTYRQPGFFSKPRRGQQVSVAQFVLAVSEVLHLDPALFHQRLEAVVDAAKAYAQFLGQRALAEIRAVVQAAHDLELDVFLEFVASVIHGDLGTLPPCRFTIGWRGHWGARGKER